MTIKNYIQHWRISAAQRLLATSQEKMSNIARASGFNSMARFHATFKRACGQTPAISQFTNCQADYCTRGEGQSTASYGQAP